MSDFESVLKLYSREICFQCKPNLPSDNRRSCWFNSLLSYVKPYTDMLFASFLKNILFFNICYYFFLSAGKACVTQNDDFQIFCLEKLFSEMYWQVYMKLEVTSWRKTQATVRTGFQHMNNLFHLFLIDLEKETPVSFHHVQ